MGLVGGANCRRFEVGWGEDNMTIECALISVSDREGLVELGSGLREMGIRILSTGGTGKALESSGVKITPVSNYTGFPEILDGRVKTLHPRIYAGILARYDQTEHAKVLEEHDILRLGLVIVNLYPFSETVSRELVSLDEAVEQIDIGGPTLIRAAAKNFEHVTVIVDPADYPSVLAELKGNCGETSRKTRWRLARKAFRHTAAYDAAISEYLEGIELQSSARDELPPTINLSLGLQETLRYGENPHQRGALYRPLQRKPSGLVSAEQLQGKQLSFNNYLDLEAAWRLTAEFEQSCCVIVKHNNPCGAALAEGPCDAYRKALACDPVSAFGSIVAFNQTVDGETAEEMRSLFVEAIIAPAYEQAALDLFSKKGNLRVMQKDPESLPAGASRERLFDLKQVSGGYVLQDLDVARVTAEDLKVVSRREPADDELKDLLFAWKVCKHVKSNAIVYARQAQTVGIGAGQMSRVDSVKLAAEKAQLSLESCVMASDAFFPFRDGIDEAVKVGVRAVIQPGGSVRDDEVIAAADEHGITMVCTGIRHFRH